MNQKSHFGLIVAIFLSVIGLIAVTRFTPLKPHWGTLETRPSSTITVTGEASKEEMNRIAQFSAGVESIEETKEEALNKANEAMNQLIAAVKALGIEDKDIQTEAANVYQETEYERAEIMIYPPMPDSGTAVKGNWRANNSISIKLRQIDMAEDVLAVLNESGANYVYGPNFMVDDMMTDDNSLLEEAVGKARAKAESIAAGNGQVVGRIISLNEGGSYPMYSARESMSFDMSGVTKEMAVADLEPGVSKIYKNVTVTFELY